MVFRVLLFPGTTILNDYTSSKFLHNGPTNQQTFPSTYQQINPLWESLSKQLGCFFRLSTLYQSSGHCFLPHGSMTICRPFLSVLPFPFLPLILYIFTSRLSGLSFIELAQRPSFFHFLFLFFINSQWTKHNRYIHHTISFDPTY